MAVTISLSIAQNSQSITNNTSNVTVKVTAKWTGGSHNAVVNAAGTPQAKGWLKIDGTQYDFASIFNQNATSSGSQTIFTKTVDVKHSDDGTKNLSCSASYNTYVSSGTVTASASKELTTIPRKSTLSVGNGTLGTSQTLTVTREATSFTHTITATCGSASSTICTKSSTTSISFTPPLAWASQNTTGTSVSVKYTITTYSGSTNVGINTYTKTCAIPASVKPTVSISVSDAAGYFDQWQVYVQSKSKLKIAITAAGIHGSTIESYTTTADGKTYTTANVTTSVIAGSGSLTIKTTVTDSRNQTATASKTITVSAYEPPKITSMEVRRCDAEGKDDPQGTYGKIMFGADVANVGGQSEVFYKLAYKKTSESTYTEEDLDSYDDHFYVSNGAYVFPQNGGTLLDLNASYNVRLTVDCGIDVITSTAILSSIKKLWSMLKKTNRTLYEAVYDSTNGVYTAGNELDGSVWGSITNYKPIAYTTSGLPVYEYAEGSHLCASIQTEISGIALNKIAELDDTFEIGFQTKFSGGITHPYLEPKTDLDKVLIPNTYIGANVSTYEYVNCPLTSGTFTLEVLGMGDNNQVMQRLTQCNKEASVYYERHYYQSSGWGPWYGGWQDATLTSEFTLYGSNTATTKPQYRKDGRLVEIRGQVAPAATITGSTDFHTIFTLPKGYRPSAPIYVICQGSGVCAWLLRVATDGTVGFSRYRDADGLADVTASNWLAFQATFLVG